MTTGIYNPLDYGAKGDGTTDDTLAFNTMFAAMQLRGGGAALIPPLTYITNNLNAPTSGNFIAEGAGKGAILKQPVGIADNTALFSLYGTTTNPNQNPANIQINNIEFLGRSDAQAFTQHAHLIALSGVCDVVIDTCTFKSWLGDAINLGSNLNGGTAAERHNERIRVHGCVFDGVNFNNRNGITILDGKDVLIDGGCYFTNCTTSAMPGAIDIEPNGFAYSRTEDINILNNVFDNVGGDAGVIGFNQTTPQASLTNPAKNFKIFGNTIRNCVNTEGAILLRQHQTPTDSTERNQFLVVDNNIDGNAGVPFEASGLRGVRFERNYFANAPSAFAIGYFEKVKDMVLSDNDFYKVGLTTGTAIEVFTADRFRIERNVFDSIGDQAGTGRLVSFDAGSGGTSTSTNVDMISNRVVGFASTFSAKDAAHTLTASTNSAYLNDTSLTVNSAHFAKQANFTYSRAGETGQDAAIRTALSGAKLVTDNTTA